MRFWKCRHVATEVSRFQPTYSLSLLLPRLNCVYISFCRFCFYTCRRDGASAAPTLFSSRIATEQCHQVFEDSVSYKVMQRAVPWLRRLAAGLPPRRPGFDPGAVHVGFVVDKVTLGQVFPRVLRFYPINFIPPVLHYWEKDKK
jgi:hypothetical protein